MTTYQKCIFSLAAAMVLSALALMLPDPEGVRDNAGQWLLYLSAAFALTLPWCGDD